MGIVAIMVPLGRISFNCVCYFRILSLVCSDYIRRVLDRQLDLLDHTQLHKITVYTFLQLLTVHYNTCRVFTLYLHWLPVFHYPRIRSPATLQLFSEDCCSARILTRNCYCPINSRAIYPVNRPQRKHLMTSSPERTTKKTLPLLHGCPLLRVYSLP
jgi:hypothetical protein